MKALADTHVQGSIPILTVELYPKWYRMVLVTPHAATAISFADLEAVCPDGQSPYCDHVPNPAAVAALAEKNGWEIGELAWDLMCGRWASEVLELGWTKVALG